MPKKTPVYHPHRPWNDLPRLPPQAELETPEVLKSCITARAALARVDGLLETLPNKNILVDAIPLQEARSSSEIENIVTTGDAIYHALAADAVQIDANAKEVLRYREALWEGMNLMYTGTRPKVRGGRKASGRKRAARPRRKVRRKNAALNAALFARICSRIRDCKVKVRTAREEVYIGGAGRIVYTPPLGPSLAALLRNLERFIASDRDGLDPLVKMAVIHYQFEAIHPFTDGNGRTGRVLNLLYLMHRRLLGAPVLYLSRYFIEHRGDYYRLIREVTERGDWQQWILYILDAVADTSHDTAKRIDAMRALFDDITQIAHAADSKAPARGGFLELLFKWPYCKIGIVSRELQCSNLTAARYLHEMVDLGVLTRIRRGRDHYFVNTRLVQLLED